MNSISEPGKSPASYGLDKRLQVNEGDVHLEEVRIQGYTIIENLLDKERVSDLCARLDDVYARQEKLAGQQFLADIQETDLARAPLLYDDVFVDLAADLRLLDFAQNVLRQPAVLHLQNGIISRPGKQHHQTAWHRDLPYQNFTISTPLALSVLVALEDFTAETGGTQLVPASHRSELVPSNDYLERNALTVVCGAGSAIVFDSMLLHRAGVNRSGRIRRAINNVYVAPILRQQIDFARAFGERYASHPVLRTLLGYDYQTADSVQKWREYRHARRRKSD